MGVVNDPWVGVVVGFSMAFSGDDAGFYGFVGNPMTHFMLKDISFTDVWQPVPTYKLPSRTNVHGIPNDVCHHSPQA